MEAYILSLFLSLINLVILDFLEGSARRKRVTKMKKITKK